MEYFIDTNRMSNHIDIITKEKRTAQRLQETIRSMKRTVLHTSNANALVLHKFQQIGEDVDGLYRYFSLIESGMDNTNVEANRIIRKIGNMLDDNRFDSKEIIDIDISKI